MASSLLDQMKAPPVVAPGKRIKVGKIHKADQEFLPLEPGDEGVVIGGNGAQIWVRFDKGYDITLIPGVDKYEVLEPAKAEKVA